MQYSPRLTMSVWGGTSQRSTASPTPTTSEGGARFKPELWRSGLLVRAGEGRAEVLDHDGRAPASHRPIARGSAANPADAEGSGDHTGPEPLADLGGHSDAIEVEDVLAVVVNDVSVGCERDVDADQKHVLSDLVDCGRGELRGARLEIAVEREPARLEVE